MNAILNGKEYKIEYTVNSLCEIEELAGMPISQLMDRQFSATRLLFWGGLRENHGELTMKDTGKIIDGVLHSGGSLEDVIDICAKGLIEGGFLQPWSEVDYGAEA